MASRSEATLVAYVAVPHAGYLALFRKYAGGRLGILGEEILQDFPPLTRNLPGVRPAEAAAMIEALNIFDSVLVLEKRDLPDFCRHGIVMPDEDVSHSIADSYLTNCQVTFDGTWRLRWDKQATMFNQIPEGETLISIEELDRAFMREATQAAERSPDWWRQVGGVLARDGKVLLTAHNRHLPSEQSAYVYGDPRSNFNAGECIDSTLSLHTEVGIIAEAARRGLSLEGCDLYVTTFPCPPCANACAVSGLYRLFYRDGYSLVAGAEVLRSRGVKLIRVQTETPSP